MPLGYVLNITVLCKVPIPTKKCIEINEHGRNPLALPFRFLLSSVEVFFSFYLLEAISQKMEKKKNFN